MHLCPIKYAIARSTATLGLLRKKNSRASQFVSKHWELLKALTSCCVTQSYKCRLSCLVMMGHTAARGCLLHPAQKKKSTDVVAKAARRSRLHFARTNGALHERHHSSLACNESSARCEARKGAARLIPSRAATFAGRFQLQGSQGRRGSTGSSLPFLFFLFSFLTEATAIAHRFSGRARPVRCFFPLLIHIYFFAPSATPSRCLIQRGMSGPPSSPAEVVVT